MVEFVVRARAAPVDPGKFRAAVGQGLGVEYLADILKHSLFVSQGHRPEVAVHLVLENSADFSRIITIRGDQLGSIDSLHERGVLAVIERALDAGKKLGKDQQESVAGGLTVLARSFEKYVKALAAERDVFVLHPDGIDIRTLELPEDPVFVMTDHTPMPKNTYKSMARQGIRPVSVGPGMLHAAQCAVLILNELDRRGS